MGGPFGLAGTGDMRGTLFLALLFCILLSCVMFAWLARDERKSWYATLRYVEWCERYARHWSDPKIQPDPYEPNPFLIDFHPLGDRSRTVESHPDLHERYMLAYDTYRRTTQARYPVTLVGRLRTLSGE